jgi:gluconokinase
VSAPPRTVVVMGVSGTGKSTVGARLAQHLGVDLVEGDSHHPLANIAKMSAGTPLDDEDRWPWLRRLAAILAERHAAGLSTVLTCSALRRGYRDVLRSGLPDRDAFFVHLHADEAVLETRMRARDHFMPPSLLRSQLDTLEALEPDETGVMLDVGRPVDRVVAEAVGALGLSTSA